MYDMLPFPNITAKSAEEQVAQINNYLIQFKETLEFILTNISTENLSQDLIEKLNTLGADIVKSNEDRDEQLQQMSNKTLTVSDVINSNAFNAALETVKPKQYLVSAEQLQVSDEPNGINIYAIEDSSGTIKNFQIKNGKDGQNGVDGADGQDGVGIKAIVIDSGNLMITLTSGTTLNLGNIKGQDGKNGVDGKTPNVNFTVNLNTGNLEYTTS